jgi:hypothetical protein
MRILIQFTNSLVSVYLYVPYIIWQLLVKSDSLGHRGLKIEKQQLYNIK